MLGFGLSEKPNHRNYTIHQQADIVEALIKDKQLKKFHVLAHDYGDTVAQELLARQVEGSGEGAWLSCCFLNGRITLKTINVDTLCKTIPSIMVNEVSYHLL